MANLAKVGSPGRSSTAVLDPCCGSGGPLPCAAALGASELVGVDSDESAFAHAAREFAPMACRRQRSVAGTCLLLLDAEKRASMAALAFNREAAVVVPMRLAAPATRVMGG